MAWLGPQPQCHLQAAIKVSVSAEVSSECSTGKGPASFQAHVVVGWILFHVGYWTEGLCSLLLLDKSPFIATWDSEYESLLYQSQ